MVFIRKNTMKKIVLSEQVLNEIARYNEIANYNFKDINEQEEDAPEGFNPNNDDDQPLMILSLDDFGAFDPNDRKVNFEFVNDDAYEVFDIEDFDELITKTDGFQQTWFSNDDSGRMLFDKYLNRFGGPYKLYIKKYLIDSQI